jgi:hypothetical protein
MHFVKRVHKAPRSELPPLHPATALIKLQKNQLSLFGAFASYLSNTMNGSGISEEYIEMKIDLRLIMRIILLGMISVVVAVSGCGDPKPQGDSSSDAAQSESESMDADGSDKKNPLKIRARYVAKVASNSTATCADLDDPTACTDSHVFNQLKTFKAALAANRKVGCRWISASNACEAMPEEDAEKQQAIRDGIGRGEITSCGGIVGEESIAKTVCEEFHDEFYSASGGPAKTRLCKWKNGCTNYPEGGEKADCASILPANLENCGEGLPVLGERDAKAKQLNCAVATKRRSDKPSACVNKGDEAKSPLKCDERILSQAECEVEASAPERPGFQECFFYDGVATGGAAECKIKPGKFAASCSSITLSAADNAHDTASVTCQAAMVPPSAGAEPATGTCDVAENEKNIRCVKAGEKKKLPAKCMDRRPIAAICNAAPEGKEGGPGDHTCELGTDTCVALTYANCHDVNTLHKKAGYKAIADFLEAGNVADFTTACVNANVTGGASPCKIAHNFKTLRCSEDENEAPEFCNQRLDTRCSGTGKPNTATRGDSTTAEACAPNPLDATNPGSCAGASDVAADAARKAAKEAKDKADADAAAKVATDAAEAARKATADAAAKAAKDAKDKADKDAADAAAKVAAEAAKKAREAEEARLKAERDAKEKADKDKADTIAKAAKNKADAEAAARKAAADATAAEAAKKAAGAGTGPRPEVKVEVKAAPAPSCRVKEPSSGLTGKQIHDLVRPQCEKFTEKAGSLCSDITDSLGHKGYCQKNKPTRGQRGKANQCVSNNNLGQDGGLLDNVCKTATTETDCEKLSFKLKRESKTGTEESAGEIKNFCAMR